MDSLKGNEYRHLFENLPDKLLFVIHNDTFEDVAFLWNEFREIYKFISRGTFSVDFDETDLFSQIKNWLSIFTGLTKKGRLGFDRTTPYMHCLLYHVSLFMKSLGSLSRFSSQGVEKNNDEIKLLHTNRMNKLNQAFDELLTRKRMEYLISDNCARDKREYVKKKMTVIGKKLDGNNMQPNDAELKKKYTMPISCLKTIKKKLKRP